MQDFNCVANFGEKITFFKELVFQLLHHFSKESIISREVRRQRLRNEGSFWGSM